VVTALLLEFGGELCPGAAICVGVADHRVCVNLTESQMSKAKLAQICVVVSLLITAWPSHAQEPQNIVLPSSAQEEQEPHRFFDKQNIALWSSVAVAHAMDCDSTWKMLDSGNGREAELPASLAQSRVGMSLFSVGVVGAQVGGSLLLHRLGWHRAERWTSAVHATTTGVTAVRNYGLRRLPPVPTPPPTLAGELYPVAH
jgi:hypothetical protein